MDCNGLRLGLILPPSLGPAATTLFVRSAAGFYLGVAGAVRPPSCRDSTLLASWLFTRMFSLTRCQLDPDLFRTTDGMTDDHLHKDLQFKFSSLFIQFTKLIIYFTKWLEQSGLAGRGSWLVRIV